MDCVDCVRGLCGLRGLDCVRGLHRIAYVDCVDCVRGLCGLVSVAKCS